MDMTFRFLKRVDFIHLLILLIQRVLHLVFLSRDKLDVAILSVYSHRALSLDAQFAHPNVDKRGPELEKVSGYKADR